VRDDPQQALQTLEVALTVRVPKSTLNRIDELVQARNTKIPRHSWLLEAIYEKIQREDKVEGVLDIFWENSQEAGTPRYRMCFLNIRREAGGALAPITAVGDDSLQSYFVRWGFAPENAKGWIAKLKSDRSISIPNVMMPADQVGPYGFRIAGTGIQKKLRDGRTAVLYPNHWKNLDDDSLKGDKVVICSPTGYAGEEATITRGGKVMITVQKNVLAHVGQPSSVVFREGTPQETEEFLDIYRQFTRD
jgi:predicted transcriptional regulator